VIEHLCKALPTGWRATLLARDGAGTAEIARQLDQIQVDATHLVVSVGGNDALGHSGMLLHEPAGSFAEVLSRLADVQEQFLWDYRGVLRGVLGHGKPTAVCTVYDSVPGLGRVEAAGLCLFNDVILREAFRAGLAVLDLRLVCTDPDDYARSSPIEPSVAGGGVGGRGRPRARTLRGRTPRSSREARCAWRNPRREWSGGRE
jgi:hypothetical protein